MQRDQHGSRHNSAAECQGMQTRAAEKAPSSANGTSKGSTFPPSAECPMHYQANIWSTDVWNRLNRQETAVA